MRKILYLRLILLTFFLNEPGMSHSDLINCGQFFIEKSVIENTYSTRRPLSAYLKKFEGLLQREINSKEIKHIVDFGAGEGVAAEELAQRTRHNITIITAKMEDKLEEANNFQIFRDRFFEQIENDELIEKFGKFDVVLDYWGVIAYTPAPGKVMVRLQELCHEDCHILVHIHNSDASSLYNSVVKLRSGEEVSLPEWYKSQDGLNIRDYGDVFDITFDPQKKFEPRELELVSSKDYVLVPGFLGWKKKETRLPPVRIFKEK